MGQPSLFAPSGEPVRFRTKKHLALLIYLAVETKTHRRERLAELLWPKVSPTEGRHSLATALSTLRPRLGPQGLETSRDHVRLTPGRVELDLDRLETGDVLGTEVTGPLEVAAFLDGFDIVDSSEFNHWKDRQQARLLPAIKDALVVLIDRCRRTGDSRQIERLADRMLALDELSEEAIRAKMEARAFAGDRLTALEFFEEWRKKLADELQAVPSDLVEGMAVRLRRRGWERTTSTNIPTVPTDQWRGRPFIGRAAEYRVLYELWEGVQRGEPGHALILGDSGVGKTTLVEKLTTAAGLEGAAISRVQCYDLEREIPYSTVSSLVLGLLDRPGVSATAPESLAELARTVPEVRHRFPNIPASNDSQGEAARICLTEAFHEMLAMVAEEHPVILVVDDLHLADDVSLAILHLMMRRARGQPVMVLLIARPGELPQSPQATKLRAAAGALGIHEIELLPLGDEESLELLRSLIPTDEAHPSLAAQRALLRAAAGYPMVLELLVQDWKASGEQSLALSVDAMTEEFGAGSPPQASYRQILDRMTRSLDNTTHNVLNLAALLGHRLNDLNMYAIVDLSAGQTMSAMAELVTRRVLRDGTQGLEFVNEMVRAAAYIGVPPTLRRVLHGNIADRFIHDRYLGDSDRGLEIAWHCIRAGRSEEATPYLLRGAREAIQSGVPYAAERGLSTALPSLAGSDRSKALTLLAEALQEQSKWDESLSVLEEVERSPQSDATHSAFVLSTRARRRLGYIDSTELAELPARFLAFMGSQADRSSRIQAAVEAASIVNAARYRRLTPLLLETVSSLGERALEVNDVAQLLLAQSMLFYNIRDFSSSLNCIAEAMNLLQKRRAVNSVLAMLQSGTGAILGAQGSYAASTAAFLQSYNTALRIGNDRIYLQASANLALGFARLGEYEKAIEWADRAFECPDSCMAFPVRLQAAQGAVLASAMLSRTSKAEELIRQRGDKFASYGSASISQAWALYSADGYAMLNMCREAEEEGIRATSGENCESHSDFCVGAYARWVARSSLPLRRVEQAQSRLDTLALSLSNYDAIDQAEVLNAKAWLDFQTGRTTSARLSEMHLHLRSLPSAIHDQLGRMGMLAFC
jgi:DNA-binding SARP family transcriptional activator/predicted ATPase